MDKYRSLHLTISLIINRQQCYLYSTTMSKITVEQQKRMNSVLQQNCLISKPDKPNDKSQQTGRHLTVTRGHPEFCVLCGKRHSMIACPLVDPVAETEPSTSTHNPEDQRIRKPSRCNDCVVVENRAEYVDGYKITTKKTKLCSGHLPASASVNPTCLVLDTQLITPLDLDDLPVLSPEILAVLDENPFSLLDYTSPAPAPASARTVSPAVIPDTSAPAPAAITTSPPAAPVIPDTSPAPVIPVTSPAAADTSPAAADTSPAAAAADTTTSPPASPQAVAAPTSHPKPTKRRYINVRRGGYSQIHEDYQRVLTNYSANNCLHKACKQAGMGRTTFFQKRHISEMEAVDADGYEQLKQRADLENMTVKEFSKLCKEQLNKSPYKQKLKALKQEGKLLP